MKKRDVVRWFNENYKGAIDLIAILLFVLSGLFIFSGGFCLLLVSKELQYVGMLLILIGGLCWYAGDWIFEFSHTKTQIKRIYRRLVKN